MVASTGDTDLRRLTDGELDARRVEMHKYAPNEADAMGRQEILAEVRRREARVTNAAEVEVPGAQRALREVAERWESALSALAAATSELRVAISARSDLRRKAFGEEPRSGIDEDRAFGRACAVLANGLRPTMWADPNRGRFLERTVAELLGL